MTTIESANLAAPTDEQFGVLTHAAIERSGLRLSVPTGDTTWVRGWGADKKQVDGGNEVHLEKRGENQHGQTTTPGTAVVLLPARNAPVTLPEPPAPGIEGMVASEPERFAVR